MSSPEPCANDVVVAYYDHCAYVDCGSVSEPLRADIVVLILFTVPLARAVVLPYERRAWNNWAWVNAPPARAAQ